MKRMSEAEIERRIEWFGMKREQEEISVDSRLQLAIETLDQVSELFGNLVDKHEGLVEEIIKNYLKTNKKVERFDIASLFADIGDSIDDLSDLQIKSDLGAVQIMLKMPNALKPRQTTKFHEKRVREVNNATVLNQFISSYAY